MNLDFSSQVCLLNYQVVSGSFLGVDKSQSEKSDLSESGSDDFSNSSVTGIVLCSVIVILGIIAFIWRKKHPFSPVQKSKSKPVFRYPHRIKEARFLLDKEQTFLLDKEQTIKYGIIL
jgi:hypothetical protein